jgi:hypothetical protein
MFKPPQFSFSWTCPQCKHKHVWNWPAEDEPRWHDVVNMNCDACKISTSMEWSYGKWTAKQVPPGEAA